MSDTTTPRKTYAILRYAKIKSFAALARVCQHNTRALVGENIIEGAPPPLELLENGSDDFVATAYVRLQELGIDQGSLEGKIHAVETVTTASRAWFDKASAEEKQEWVRANLEWAKKKFDRGLLSAKLHLDEEVWHIHFVALPVAEKQELPRGTKPKDPVKLVDYERRKASAPMRWTVSYHDVLGGKNKRLSEEQDAYHAAVKHLGLERGEIQRDDIEIEVGDELTISALELSRGHNPDGTARPRRSMTPAQGRAAVKRLRSEAEAAKQAAEEARMQTAVERDRASAERAKAERLVAETANRLAEATRNREAVDRDRDAVEQNRSINDEQRRRLVDERRLLELAVERAEQDRMVLISDRDEIRNAAAKAAEEHQAAQKERETIAAERKEIVEQKAAIAVRAHRQRAEIDLLARGADDANGLNLRPKDKSFVMTTEAMTDGEQAVFSAPWTSGAAQIGRVLAAALERIRKLTADLWAREGRIKLREIDLTRREDEARARDGDQIVAAEDLGRQRREQLAELDAARRALADRARDIDSREIALTEREVIARHRANDAITAAAQATQREAEHRDWMVVIASSADGSLMGSYSQRDGYFRMSRATDETPYPAPVEILRTIASPPPEWAAKTLILIDKTFADTAKAAMRLMRVEDEASELQEMIANARTSLPLEQQPAVDPVDRVHDDVANRLHRLAGIQDQGTLR